MRVKINIRKKTAYILIIVIVLIGIAVYMNMSAQNNKSQLPNMSSSGVYSGKVTKLDLSAMPRDGDGIIEIESATNLKSFHVSSGESSCDRQAITIPNDLTVGKDVEIMAKSSSSGKYLSICEEGTYIKIL